MKYTTTSQDETFELGRKLGEKIERGRIICLDGELGVGKTVFTQGFARGLGIQDNVNSPTFTILQIYEDGRMPMYHFDVYRIGDYEEMYEIGYEEYFFGEGVCLIEWSQLIKELLPAGCIKVQIRKDLEKGLDYREIEIEE